MKKLRQLLSAYQAGRGGFTMVELLIVIAIISILAVVLLGALNPVEQLNRSRDTRTQTEAGELLKGIERYFTAREEYPWNTTAEVATVEEAYDGIAGTAGFVAWSQELVDLGELKDGFISRVNDNAEVAVFKILDDDQVYSCYLPRSNANKELAAENCVDGITPTAPGTNIVTCPNGAAAVPEDDNYICLPQ